MWHRERSILLLLLTAVLPLLPLQASTPGEFLIEVWDTDRGLPHSTVTSLAQTPDGYLWVGTLHGGLTRFDGVSFTTFHPGNAPALRSIELSRLLVEKSGLLWIGTVDGSITSLEHGVFRYHRTGTNLPAEWLWDLVGTRSDGSWLRLQGGTLVRIQTQATNAVPEIVTPPGHGPSAFICMDAQGAIWHRARDGSLSVNRDRGFKPFALDPALGKSVVQLVADPQGRAWICTERGFAFWSGTNFVQCSPEPAAAHDLAFTSDGGVWVRGASVLRKFKDGKWVAEATPWDGRFRPSSRQISMRPDADGGVWIVHYGEGVWYVAPDGRVQHLSEQEGLPGGLVECWLQDAEGNVWLGMSGGGLVRLRKRDFYVLWPGDLIQGRAGRSVCVDADGSIWAGTSSDLLFRSSRGKFKTYSLPSEKKLGRDLTVCPDPQGRLWVGTVQDGVWLLENEELRRPFPAEAVGTVARALYADREGRVWLGSEFGLYVWENEALRRIGPREGFGNAYVLSITEDPAGALWVGTADSEIRRIHQGKTTGFKPSDNYGTTRVWSLLAEADGTVWAGTLGGGLLRFREGKFVRYLKKDGLPDENITQLLDDGQGQLWAGSRAGIFRVEKALLHAFAEGAASWIPCHVYGRFDGLPTEECASGFQPSAWKANDGRLWFATVKGLVSVNPGTLSRNPNPPPVVIEQAWVDGKQLSGDPGARRSVSTQPAPARLRVNPGQHFFEFRFTALSFVAPDKVRFRWRLYPLEEEWVEGGGRRLATYSFVPPGTYSFQVKASNNDGVWNEAGDRVQLTVLPHFWQTWWFRVLAGLAIASLLGLAYSVRVARLRALARMRLRIARDLHDEVGANLGSISLLAQVMERKPTATDAVQVREIAAQTIDTLRDIVWFIDPTHEHLGDLVARMEETSRRIAGHLRFSFQAQGDFHSANLSLEFRRNAVPILKEALHNAVRHSGATAIEVRVSRPGHRFRLEIEDDGAGFDPHGHFGGNGLKNMRKRGLEMRGQVEIRSSPGKGTIVTLEAPIT